MRHALARFIPECAILRGSPRRRGAPSLRSRQRMSSPTEDANPMHGVTLERILNELVAHYGWNAMGQKIDIRCFNSDPSVASSLKFLRRTPWARQKVERMYGDLLRVRARQPKPDAPAITTEPSGPAEPVKSATLAPATMAEAQFVLPESRELTILAAVASPMAAEQPVAATPSAPAADATRD